jgi:hypothetical protein
MINLEEGKRYTMRNGEITGPLKLTPTRVYPFFDDDDGYAWMEDGCRNRDRSESELDIVSEYQEQYLTTETRHGLIAVLREPQKAEVYTSRGTWGQCPINFNYSGADALLAHVVHKKSVFRIKNPAYVPPKLESKVGEGESN